MEHASQRPSRRFTRKFAEDRSPRLVTPRVHDVRYGAPRSRSPPAISEMPENIYKHRTGALILIALGRLAWRCSPICSLCVCVCDRGHRRE